MKLTDDAEAVYRMQDYGTEGEVDGVVVLDLPRFNDDGGSMTELARLRGGRLQELDGFEVAQVNFSTIASGAVKAFHVHRRQTDVWYVPPEDRILLVLVDVRKDSPTEGRRQRLLLGDGRSRLVRIPAGVAHGCRNLAGDTGRIVYFTNLHFSSERGECDEGRLPWDFVGADVWESSRE